MRSTRLRTVLLVFAVSTALAGLIGKALWDSGTIGRGLDAALRSVCSRWDLPLPESVEELEADFGVDPDVPANDWMRVSFRVPPEKMSEWMEGARVGMGSGWTDSDDATHRRASKFGAEGGTTHLHPYPPHAKFDFAEVFADPEEGKIDIVWIR